MSRGLLKKAKALRKQQNAKKKANKKNAAGILVFLFIVAAIVAYLLVPRFLENRSAANNNIKNGHESEACDNPDHNH